MTGERGSLRGRIAVVTGGGRGIGAAVARAMAREEATVVVAARSSKEVDAVAKELRELGSKAQPVTVDVTDPGAINVLAYRVRKLVGPVDILVNSAGRATSAPFHEVTLSDWEALQRVNATAPFLVTQAFLPEMLERGWGRIVNIASVASHSGAPYITAYAASKHALLGMTRCLAAELAGTGVTANAVCPSYVDTAMTDSNIGHIARKTGRSTAEVRAQLEEKLPGGRFITPDEVAHAVMMFLPDPGGALQGASVVIRGGGRP